MTATHLHRSNAARRARPPHPRRPPPPFRTTRIPATQTRKDGSKFILETTNIPSPSVTSKLIFPNPMDIRMQFHTPLVFSPGEAGKWCYGNGARPGRGTWALTCKRYILHPWKFTAPPFARRTRKSASTVTAVTLRRARWCAAARRGSRTSTSWTSAAARDYARVLLGPEAARELFRPQLLDAEQPRPADSAGRGAGCQGGADGLWRWMRALGNLGVGLWRLRG